MKSDQEFLKGIYEKADQLRQLDDKDKDKLKVYQVKEWNLKSEHPHNIYKYGSFVAVFLVLLIVTLFISFPKTEQYPISREPFNLNDKNTRGINILDILFDSSTDIVKVGKDSKNRLETRKVYKGILSTTDILNTISTKGLELEEDQTAIIFIQADSEGLVIMDIFLSDDSATGTFINEYGDTLLQDELEKY
jgi:hypothetical protein